MRRLGERLAKLEGEGAGGRFFVVSGPEGFDAAASLAAKGIAVGPADMVVTINKPGDVAVEVIRSSVSHEQAVSMMEGSDEAA